MALEGTSSSIIQKRIIENKYAHGSQAHMEAVQALVKVASVGTDIPQIYDAIDSLVTLSSSKKKKVKAFVLANAITLANKAHLDLPLEEDSKYAALYGYKLVKSIAESLKGSYTHVGRIIMNARKSIGDLNHSLALDANIKGNPVTEWENIIAKKLKYKVYEENSDSHIQDLQLLKVNKEAYKAYQDGDLLKSIRYFWATGNKVLLKQVSGRFKMQLGSRVYDYDGFCKRVEAWAREQDDQRIRQFGPVSLQLNINSAYNIVNSGKYSHAFTIANGGITPSASFAKFGMPITILRKTRCNKQDRKDNIFDFSNVKPENINGKDILIIEDDISEGITIRKVVEGLEKFQPKSITLYCSVDPTLGYYNNIHLKPEHIGLELDTMQSMDTIDEALKAFGKSFD